MGKKPYHSQWTDPKIASSTPPSADELRDTMMAGIKSMVAQSLSGYKEVDAEGTEIDQQQQARQAEFDNEMTRIIAIAKKQNKQDEPLIRKALAACQAVDSILKTLSSTVKERHEQYSGLSKDVREAYSKYPDVDRKLTGTATNALIVSSGYFLIGAHIDNMNQANSGLTQIIELLNDTIEDINK